MTQDSTIYIVYSNSWSSSYSDILEYVDLTLNPYFVILRTDKFHSSASHWLLDAW